MARGVEKGGNKGDMGMFPGNSHVEKIEVFVLHIIAMVISIYVFSFWGLGHQTLTRALTLDPAGDFCSQSPCFVPLRNKFVATPLVVAPQTWNRPLASHLNDINISRVGYSPSLALRLDSLCNSTRRSR